MLNGSLKFIATIVMEGTKPCLTQLLLITTGDDVIGCDSEDVGHCERQLPRHYLVSVGVNAYTLQRGCLAKFSEMYRVLYLLENATNGCSMRFSHVKIHTITECRTYVRWSAAKLLLFYMILINLQSF